MKNCFFPLVAAVVLTLCSCGNNDTTAAMSLLDEARRAMKEARFDDARSHINSLRTTYPKEFDARRAALVLADSIELQEAKAMKTAIDSLVTFKAFELDDAKARFAFEKHEKYQSQGYYVLPKYAGNKSAYRFFPEVEESGKLLLVQVDAKRKYQFTEVPISDDGYWPYTKGLGLTNEQEAEVAICYELSKRFHEYQELSEQQEKTNLKIRFFERKLKEQ